MKTRVLFFILMLGTFSCGKKDATVIQPETTIPLAVIDQDTLSLADFRAFIRRANYHRVDLSQARERQRLLQEFVNEWLMLKSADARDSLLLDSLSVGIRNAEDEYLARRFIRNQVIEPLIPEEELHALYQRMNTEINVRQLFVFHNENQKVKVHAPDVPYRNRLQAKKIADSLMSIIRVQPNRFEELIMKHSDDMEYKSTHGEVGYIHYDKYDPRFRDVLLNMPVGAISEVLESPDGFHIFQKLGQRDAAMTESYEKMRPVLLAIQAQQYDARPTEKMVKQNRYLIDSLLIRYGFTYREENIRMYLKRYAGVSRPSDLPDAFKPEEKRAKMAVFSGGSVDISEIVAVMADNRTRVRLDESRMKEGLRNIATTRVLAAEARKAGLTTDYRERQELTNLRIQLMKDILLRRYAEPEKEVSEENLQRFYTQNLMHYKEPDRVNFYELFSTDQRLIREYREEAIKQKTLEKIGPKAEEKKGNRFAESGLVPVNPKQELTLRAWEMEPGQISDIFTWSYGGYSVIQLIEKKPGRQKTYEEVKEQLKSDYYAFRKKNLYTLWITRLREQHPVKTFEKNLDDIYNVTIR